MMNIWYNLNIINRKKRITPLLPVPSFGTLVPASVLRFYVPTKYEDKPNNLQNITDVSQCQVLHTPLLSLVIGVRPMPIGIFPHTLNRKVS